MKDNDWKPFLDHEYQQPYFQSLRRFIHQEYRTKRIFPPAKQLLRCLELTPFSEVKVVVLGQDPYYRYGQAEGLCFSVPMGIPIPKSLQNIFRELYEDLGVPPPSHGHLSAWARQGVLLLNTVLTVEEGKPLSHKDQGWEIFTEHIIRALNDDDRPKVFVLWGAEAGRKAEWITHPQHRILRAPHPSPLAAHRGFFGSKPFSKINEFLTNNGRSTIDWSLPIHNEEDL